MKRPLLQRKWARKQPAVACLLCCPQATDHDPPKAFNFPPRTLRRIIRKLDERFEGARAVVIFGVSSHDLVQLFADDNTLVNDTVRQWGGSDCAVQSHCA